MNTLHFRYAVEIEKTGSITQAAENLFMAQPNLSKAIKELEETLGITIFKRNPNGVVPTKKGAEFLVHAKNILLQIEKMEALKQPENSERQSFSVSIPRSSYISCSATRFISELDRSNEIRITIRETDSMKTIGYIVDGRYNLGVIRYQTIYEKYFIDYLTEKKLRYEQIWKYEYIVLMARTHPLADSPVISRKDLGEYTEIMYGDTAVPYIPPAEIKNRGDAVRGKKRIYVYDRGSRFDILTHMPAAYMLSAPVPEEYLELYGLVQRKCDFADNMYKDLLIYRKGYRLTELDKGFVNKLFDIKNEMAFLEYN